MRRTHEFLVDGVARYLCNFEGHIMRLVSVQPACVIVPLSAVLFLAACTGGSGSRTPSAPTSRPRPSVVCPGAGGDAAFGPPTLVVPAGPDLHGRITMLAHTTPLHGSTVHAVVRSLSKTKPDVTVLVRSRIVLTRKVWETVSAARGIANPLIDPDQFLSRSNVIATSRTVRTTDLADHALTLAVPARLTPRDYFVVAFQHATELCDPPRNSGTESLIGLVRVLARDGHVAVLKRLPPHVK